MESVRTTLDYGRLYLDTVLAKLLAEKGERTIRKGGTLRTFEEKLWRRL